MRLTHLRSLALALSLSLLGAWMWTELAPRRYVATAAVLVSGSGLLKLERVSYDPRRAASEVAAAARPFRVILVDTPAASRGPDLEIFAALAGGALVVQRRNADQAGLPGLRRMLETARAHGVGGAHRLMDDRGYVAQALFDRLGAEDLAFRVLGDALLPWAPTRW